MTHWRRSFKRTPLAQFYLLSIRSFLREPTVVFWAFGFPLLTTLLFAQAFSEGSSNDGFIVALHKPESLDARWVQEIRKESGIKVLEAPQNALDGFEQRADELRNITSVTQLPDGLRQVFLNEKADVLLSPAGVFSIRTAGQFKVQEERLLALYEKSQGGALHAVHMNVPGVRFVDWFVPGMIGLTLLSGGLWGVTLRIASDREQGLFKRLLLGPFRKIDYILGFSAARTFMMFTQIIILSLMFRFTFGFQIQGNAWLFYAFGLAGGLCSCFLGAAVAARTRKSETASGVANVFFFPMMFLSGVYFKTENFPDFIRSFANVLPLTALNQGLRLIANEGAGIERLWPQFALLAAWSVVCLAITVKFFDWGTES